MIIWEFRSKYQDGNMKSGKYNENSIKFYVIGLIVCFKWD